MNHCIQNIKHRRQESGLAAVEFIICLPVLLIMTVLLIDVGRALIQYTEINKALQNGARYAVVSTYGTLDFTAIANEADIQNVVVYGKAFPTDVDSKVIKYLEPSDVVITQPTASTKEVTLSANFSYVPLFTRLPFTDTSLEFTFGASTKMRTAP